MIEIPLSKRGKNAGKYTAMVSDEDKDLASLNWTANFHSLYNTYAVAAKNIKMHRVILGRVLGRELEKGEDVDHIDGNGLNNQRDNLRLVNRAQNNQNRKKSSNNGSGYKGVDWDRTSKKWRARIWVNQKSIWLGLKDTPEEAHELYKEAAIKYYGEFANFGE